MLVTHWSYIFVLTRQLAAFKKWQNWRGQLEVVKTIASCHEVTVDAVRKIAIDGEQESALTAVISHSMRRTNLLGNVKINSQNHNHRNLT